MDNIDLLLNTLDGDGKDETPEENFLNETPSTSQLHTNSDDDDTSLSNNQELETAKKSISRKYSEYGYEIHKQLKEKTRSSQDNFKPPATWKSRSNEKTKQDVLTAPASQSGVKNDVYAEPIFGLRLINPIVSSQFIQTKMVGRTPITLAKLPHHLNCGDKNTDWVIAGAIVFKSGLRNSQKGSQYCFWKISDLKHDLKQVTVYLFGKAGSELWKLSLGSVVAVLNPSHLNKDETAKKDDISLSVRNADQIMVWGMSRDYGICKAKKKNGENCTSFVNKSICEFCLYHVKSEYNKYTGKRFDLQASYSNGLTELRNKVLGKNEVFYGGKSFTASKPPPKNNKHKQKDNSILANLSMNPPPPSLAKTNAKITSMDYKTFEQLNEATSIADIERKNNEKPLVSARLSLFKEAGKRLIETGEVTQITAVKLDKKKTFVSFATMFSPENCDLPSKVTKSTKENLNSPKSTIENLSNTKPTKENLSIPKTNITTTVTSKSSNKPSSSITLKPCEEIVLDFDHPLPKKSISVKFGESPTPKPSTSRISKTNNLDVKDSPCPLNSKQNPTSNNRDPLPFQNTPSEISHNSDTRNLLKSRMEALIHHSASRSSPSLHKKKRDQAKMEAIRLIKQKGGLAKTNPNEIRPKNDEKRTSAVKRALDSNEEEDESSEISSFKRTVLSERFIELMNTQSSHENLIQLAADMEEQNYFNKMEKKEQLEEKMLTTYKVPCKAVSCLKCKYKWFSASDRCKAEGHPIKVIDAVKRFFKCENCSNRTVSLDIIPLVCCKNCGSSRWSRAPMIKEKVCNLTSNLSIRGDEVKFIDSFSEKPNLNLLVPE